MTAAWSGRTSARDDSGRRRRQIRYAAAALSAATALLYFGIGAGVLKVVDQTSADTPSLFEFGVLAGAAFLLGTLLLLAFDRRALWLLGAIFQVGVIVMYVAVSPQRTPPFEQWGILIKVLQIAILAALAWLTVRPRSPRSASAWRSVG